MGQGIVGIESRVDDLSLKEMLRPLNSQQSEWCLVAERSMNRVLEGGCSVPIAGFAQLDDDKISLCGRVGNIHTGELLEATAIGSTSTAEELGKQVAEELLSQGARALINQAE